ncbi:MULTISPECIES: hypothetical protein [Halorussus]|uniref:hypothetical protein n=1 Tax=Halorussus TaxID=1070314 RepID=UPI0020A1A79F|nr:hypothetical protein [Halorussus vallis]USZ74890.1 hypothetical protein NGM07_15800 [Halorussus vallis]
MRQLPRDRSDGALGVAPALVPFLGTVGFGWPGVRRLLLLVTAVLAFLLALKALVLFVSVGVRLLR